MGVAVWLVSAVMAVYEAAQIVVRTAKGDCKVNASVRLHTLSGKKIHHGDHRTMPGRWNFVKYLQFRWSSHIDCTDDQRLLKAVVCYQLKFGS